MGLGLRSVAAVVGLRGDPGAAHDARPMRSIRAATPGDAKVIVALIRELAAYEREPDAAVATEEDILRDGFGDRPRFEVLIAEEDGEVAGFAFYFFTYSTWRGRPCLYLEDLFVRPPFRRRGLGLSLLRELAKVAVRERCERMVWQVLDWNAPAIAFYEELGARAMREWITMRVEGDAIGALSRGG